ncbi:unnamed protein product [Cylicocyclus nassatus]|uniref:RWD domain-containing protein n=1 Tax=Cylicocyclus nassatus TaxID=53992 RepID=A0AA36GKH2_CYLNA|nr:unnamed protein product [Cylicocyclus nassatus]
MDHKEQQIQEIEALQAIYQEEELEVICDEYPNISVRVNLKSNQENESPSDFEVALVVELPEDYPDAIPRIRLEGIDHLFTKERIQKAVQLLENEAGSNLGMVMVFTVVSALQDELGVLLAEKMKEAELKVEEEKQKEEAISRKKFEGTPVTPETFLAWKEKFDKERKALMEKNQKDRETALAGKLTGKQLFLRDATLSLSDVALIEQSVEIDESLFDEEIEGLELESDED